ncbi:hypothetical protein GCM10025868_08860 [Angustibacter aerolatus]|uniref:Uncharacterized protein n=1 Tax=Angustibacter aerolatus TaxID=1162965 RepID=A0ABQ6JDI7_9ACTN|nr:hypothetical protein GCM10025868_08860 [Angustibacter aerolatus]
MRTATALGSSDRLVEQPQQHDLLLERVEHRADGEREVGAEAGEVVRAGQHHALLALLDQRTLERADDPADERALGAVEPARAGRAAGRRPR